MNLGPAERSGLECLLDKILGLLLMAVRDPKCVPEEGRRLLDHEPRHLGGDGRGDARLLHGLMPRLVRTMPHLNPHCGTSRASLLNHDSSGRRTFHQIHQSRASLPFEERPKDSHYREGNQHDARALQGSGLRQHAECPIQPVWLARCRGVHTR